MLSHGSCHTDLANLYPATDVRHGRASYRCIMNNNISNSDDHSNSSSRRWLTYNGFNISVGIGLLVVVVVGAVLQNGAIAYGAALAFVIGGVFQMLRRHEKHDRGAVR